MMTANPAAEIEERFQCAFDAVGTPPEMAVLTRSESEGRLIDHFSTAAVEVAKAFAAQQCARPARTGLFPEGAG